MRSLDLFDKLALEFQANWEVVWRLTLAAVLGGVFGLEREVKGREAGLRTNILISVSSCLFTYLGIAGFPYSEGAVRDPARIAAQIVSGVGFLGAGALLVYKNKVRGMTTAATIWVVAAVGMAAGAGASFTAVFTTVLSLLTLVLLNPVSRGLEARAQRRYEGRKKIEKLHTVGLEGDEEDSYWLEEETD